MVQNFITMIDSIASHIFFADMLSLSPFINTMYLTSGKNSKFEIMLLDWTVQIKVVNRHQPNKQ